MLDLMATSLFRPEQRENLLALKPVKSTVARRRLFFSGVVEADLGDRTIRRMSAAASLTFMHGEAL
jgi:hypothetical protein